MVRRLIEVSALGVIALASLPASAGPAVGYITLDGALPERPPVSSPFAGMDRTVTFRDMVGAIDSAASDRRGLRGLVLRLTTPELSLAQVEELGAAITRFRETGRRVHVFAEQYGPTELLLASYADEVILQAGGGVTFPGLYMEEMFLADALRSVGVTPDFVQVGDFKGASEMMANSAPSPQWNENINQLLDGLYGFMSGRIMSGRKLDRSALDRAMSEAILADDRTAVRVGLIDAAMDRLDLDDHIERAYGADFEWADDIDPSERARPDLANMNFFQAFSQLMSALSGGKRGPVRDTIAVLHIDGAIVDGESSPGGFLSGRSVGSLTIRKTLLELEEDPLVRGVIVRIDSPGGSAMASESMWLGLRRLAETKPVWTSVGGMAASGGYYTAVAGERIYLNESSIVGSIGVVGGKLAMRGLYEKVKVNVVSRSRGPMAGMLGGLSPWTDAERDLIRRRMTDTYDLFVERVKAGRSGVDISKIGEGRLFVGQRAVELGMADALGGLDAAAKDMARELGLAPGSYDLVDFPPPPTLEEMIDRFLSVEARADASLALWREVLGERAWERLTVGLRAMMELRREPVLLTSPRVLIFR